jgi:hypothetical protein
VRKRERELHAHASRKCRWALSVPHSNSLSLSDQFIGCTHPLHRSEREKERDKERGRERERERERKREEEGKRERCRIWLLNNGSCTN